MEAEIVDIESIRARRADIRRAEAAVFGRLPCPCCDRMTSAEEVVQGRAQYSCEGGGSHQSVRWTYDGGNVVSDHAGRVRKFFAY